MTTSEVLSEAGVDRSDPLYGLEFNLCQAAMRGGLGTRHGSSRAVQKVLVRQRLAEADSEKVEVFIGRVVEAVKRLGA